MNKFKYHVGDIVIYRDSFRKVEIEIMQQIHSYPDNQHNSYRVKNQTIYDIYFQSTIEKYYKLKSKLDSLFYD